MAFQIADRVKETSTTTGTGTYSLGGALTGFQTFAAAITSGNTVPYLVTDGTDWEVGLGTFTDAVPDTLARTSILASSNAGSAVSWSAGQKIVAISLPASYAVMTQMAAVTFVGAITATGGLLADTISEITGANGVTIDGLNIKDGAIGPNGVVTASLTALSVTLAKMANGTRGGLIHFAGASGAATDAGAGTDGYVWTAAGVGADAGWEAPSTGPFSNYFVSSAKACTAGVTGSATHGLGGLPKMVIATLKCTSADANFASGDEISIASIWEVNNNRGISLWANSTQIEYAIGTSGLALINATTGVVTALDESKWELYLKAVR